MEKKFFNELSELEKIEKAEKKEKTELYLRKKFYFFQDWVFIVPIMLLSIFIIGAATYATYLFIDVTSLGDISNVHVTKSLMTAKRAIEGRNYSDPDKDISNWIVYTDKENGFEIKYPQEWIRDKEDSRVFSIKKYNKREGVNDSLEAVMIINEEENIKNLSLEGFLREKLGQDYSNYQKVNIGQNEIIGLRNQKGKEGLEEDNYFWSSNGNIYSIRCVHYQKMTFEIENDFQKIISEFKILK